MKSVYVIYYISDAGELYECEVFSKLEYAQKFQEDLEKLYGYGVSFWQKPIDIISCSMRNSYENLATGYVAESKYGAHIWTGETINIDHDSDFWNDDQPEIYTEINVNNNIQELIEFCDQEIDTLVQLCQDSHSETATLVNMGSITAYKEIQKKLKEQLTNKEIKMTNVFTDQAAFMTASDQTVGEYNDAQYKLYLNLIREEFNELQVAIDDDDKTEQLDALLDMIVVIVGAIHSAGFDGEGGWNEVIRSNMSKIDPETGKVKKREDGKVLKPASFSPPNLAPFIKENT